MTAAATPSVEQARHDYWLGAHRLGLLVEEGYDGTRDDTFALWVEARSIVLDLAIAEHVARKSVAW